MLEAGARNTTKTSAAVWRDDPRHGLVAGALLYLLVVSVAYKVMLALDMAPEDSPTELLGLVPFALASDLWVVGCTAVLVYLVARVAGPKLRIGIGALLVVTFGAWLAVNYVSYQLIGAPITWQIMRGDQGGTVGDLELLRGDDAWTVAVGTTLAVVLVVPFLWIGHRVSALRRACGPAGIAAFVLVALVSFAAADAWGPETYGLGENPVTAFGQSVLIATADADSGKRLDRSQWEALHRPLLADTTDVGAPSVDGPPPRNVIVILAEGIPWHLTSFGAPEEDPTPNLRRRAEEHGLLFDRYYATWHSSIQSLFAVACAEYPTTDVDYRTIVTLNPRIDCGELSQVLSDGRRHAGLFHGGHFSFYDKLGFLGGRDYEVAEDAASLEREYPKRESNKWGIDDRAVVDEMLAWIDGLPEGHGFASFMVPITAHYPFWTPSDFDGPYEGGDERTRFLNAVRFSDEVFERLATGLEERGLYEDTLIVWLADHGTAVKKRPRPTPGRTFYQQSLHVPLVLLNPRMFPPEEAGGQRVSHRVGSHVDVLPTVLDALGLPPDSRHRGQSLISDDWEPRRAFFGAFRRGKTYVGFVEGDHKVVLDPETGETEYYDLAEDPGEENDLTEEHLRRIDLWTDDLARFHQGMLEWIPSRPTLDDLGNVHEAVLTRARVELRRDGKAVSCAAEGGARRCPGAEHRVVEEKVRRVGRHRSRCLMLRLPEDGELDIQLSGPIVKTVSGARLGIPNAVRDDEGGVEMRVYVDGDQGADESFGPKSNFRRVRFPTPMSSLRLVVKPKGQAERPCLLLSDSAWRNKDH
ncbi:MAG: LTA synthase family protein [Polyangiales bacterium]